MPNRNSSWRISGHCQTYRHKIKPIGALPTACQKVIDRTLSLLVSFLAINTHTDQAKAAYNSIKWPADSAISGRITTIVPAKPNKIAVQRRIPTDSLKNRIESRVAKIGTVNNRVVASASGTRLRPVNTHTMPDPPNRPRVICKG